MRPEIHSANSLGEFWIELSARFRSYYAVHDERKSAESSSIIRASCLYAIWCARSESIEVRQPALIEFYQRLPRFAVHCNPSNYKRIVDDLVSHLGIAELEKESGEIGFCLKADQKKKFMADLRQAEAERQMRSRKK
jgi:hypothetical protein